MMSYPIICNHQQRCLAHDLQQNTEKKSLISSGEGPLCSGQCGITYFGYQSYSIIWFMNSYFSHEIISITKAPPSGGGSGNKSTLCSIHMAYSPWPLSLFSFVTWLSGLCNADYLWQSLVKPNVFVMERGGKKQCYIHFLWVKSCSHLTSWCLLHFSCVSF